MYVFIRHTWFFVLFLVLGLSIYSNVFHVPFLFDDARNIQHPELRINEFSKDSIVNALVGGELGERPVSNLSFGLNYFFHGYELPGYHAVNIAFHILAGFFLYLLLQRTLHRAVNPATRGHCKWIAELSALLWLVHPLATQSVTYIVQRMSVMAAFFYIVSIYLYVVGREKQEGDAKSNQGRLSTLWIFLLSTLSGCLAIGSKENAATLPAFIFLYEWFFFQDLSWHWLKKKIPWLIGLVFIFAAFAYIYLNGHPVRYVLNGCSSRDFTMGERLLTQPRVVWHYISLLLYPSPSRLVFDYNFPVSTAWLTPVTTIVSFIGLCVALVLACIFAKRERLLAFCVLWFLGNLAIESSFICLEMVFEHRTYLPSMFFVLFWVLLLNRLFRNKVIFSTLLVFVILFISYWTYERNKIWQDPVTFWQDSVDKQPGKARSYNNLGRAYYLEDNMEEAKENYLNALAVSDKYFLSHNNIGLVYAKLGEPEQAELHFRRALELKSNYVDAYVNLGILLMQNKRYAEAEASYLKALKIAPRYTLLLKNLSTLLLNVGRVDEALGLLQPETDGHVSDDGILLNLGEAYMRLGKSTEAKKVYEKVFALDSESVNALFNLGLLSGREGDEDMALYYFEEALKHEPNQMSSLYFTGNIYYKKGRLEQARDAYSKIISLYPKQVKAYVLLAETLLKMKRHDEAVSILQNAAIVAPQDGEIISRLQQVKEMLEGEKQ